MSLLSILALTLLSISSSQSFNYQRIANDDICDVKFGILCLHDELLIVKTVAEGIIRRVNDIEKNIQRTKAFDRLNHNVNQEMNFTSYYSPSFHFHEKFFRVNNIDKDFLIEIFVEAHTAMIFYYHSIGSLLKDEDVFAHKTDEWFEKIRNTIRSDIICRYESALHVFSHRWQSNNNIGEIYFSKQHRLSPSVTHDVHSVVIAKYLKQWMERINNVIDNIPAKIQAYT